MQQALRHSPDHAPARARALVEQGQLEALHQFVRDEIRLISPHPDDFRLDGNPRGVRVTLRSGAGTGREQAELLADLVRQTGGQARVVEVTSNEPAKAYFFRDFATRFEPQVTPEKLADWRQRLGLVGKVLPADAGAADDLVEQLTQALGAEAEKLGRHRFDERLHSRLPLVKIEGPDGPLYADVVRPAGKLERLEGLKAADPPADDGLPIEVRLTALREGGPRRGA